MTRTATWDCALVLGNGYAGLLAARVLTGHFRHVTRGVVNSGSF